MSLVPIEMFQLATMKKQKQCFLLPLWADFFSMSWTQFKMYMCVQILCFSKLLELLFQRRHSVSTLHPNVPLNLKSISSSMLSCALLDLCPNLNVLQSSALRRPTGLTTDKLSRPSNKLRKDGFFERFSHTYSLCQMSFRIAEDYVLYHRVEGSTIYLLDNAGPSFSHYFLQ